MFKRPYFPVLFNLQGCYPATYRVEHSFQRGKPVSLNPDHTHFLMVDDGTQGQCGAKEVQFRARLERVIADKTNIEKQSKWLCCKYLEN